MTLFVFIFATSCSDSSTVAFQEIPETKENLEKTESVDEHFISKDAAVEIVNNFLDEIDSSNDNLLRSGKSKRTIKEIHMTNDEGVKTYSSMSDDVRMYVINFDDDEGFALVSADDRTSPIYAITESGNLNKDDTIDNPGLQIFFAGLENYYKAELEGYREEIQEEEVPITLRKCDSCDVDLRGEIVSYSNWITKSKVNLWLKFVGINALHTITIAKKTDNRLMQDVLQ